MSPAAATIAFESVKEIVDCCSKLGAGRADFVARLTTGRLRYFSP